MIARPCFCLPGKSRRSIIRYVIYERTRHSTFTFICLWIFLSFNPYLYFMCTRDCHDERCEVLCPRRTWDCGAVAERLRAGGGNARCQFVFGLARSFNWSSARQIIEPTIKEAAGQTEDRHWRSKDITQGF
jgi:hypothetical protein